MPPKIQEVRIYFNQKGVPEKEADNFYSFYEKREWKSRKGIALKKWNDVAREWTQDILWQKRRFQNRNIL
jgi:hypothetical protein